MKDAYNASHCGSKSCSSRGSRGGSGAAVAATGCSRGAAGAATEQQQQQQQEYENIELSQIHIAGGHLKTDVAADEKTVQHILPKWFKYIN